MYKTVETSEMLHYFKLDSEQKLLSLMKLTGEMEIDEIRSRICCKINDAIDMIAKMELYQSRPKLKVRVLE
jgi:hypothetical protein